MQSRARSLARRLNDSLAADLPEWTAAPSGDLDQRGSEPPPNDALTGLRKRGYALERSRNDKVGPSVYRLTPASLTGA